MGMHVTIDKKQVEEALDEILEKIAEMFLEECKKSIKMLDAIASKQLINSGKVKKEDRGVYVVEFDAPYAGYVEFGTFPREKYPPHEKIAKWLMDKFGYDKRKANKLAWAIMKKIKDEGTPPKPFIRMTISRLCGGRV